MATETPPESSIAIGSIIGPCRLGAPLGSGGMGVVHEAELVSGDAVAVKILRLEWLNDEFFRRRFQTEAMAGHLVRHPNVAAVIEDGVTEAGVPFLVMERVRGETLRRRLEREGVLTAGRAAAIVGQILAGLDAMHRAGIVHGDIKCDNIMVESLADGSEAAKLIDFGLAEVEHAGPGEQLADGMVSGTPEYMAPEVICGRGSSPASDMYAAGVVLYELLTGATPFCGGTSAQVLRRHLDEDVVPPSLRAPGWTIPRALERVVMRALDKDRRRRFPSAFAFASALGSAMPHDDELRQPGHAPDQTRWNERSTRRWRRGRAGKTAQQRRRVAIGTPTNDVVGRRQSGGKGP